MAIKIKDSFDMIMSSGSEDDDSQATLFRTRGRHMSDFRPPSVVSNFPPPKPWRKDAASACSTAATMEIVSDEYDDFADDEESLPSPVPIMTPKSESKRELKRARSKSRSKRRGHNHEQKRGEVRYPLNGTTPSEKMLAGFICCADLTLNFFENQCGIEEEMETIRGDVAWCHSLFCV